MQQTNLLKDYAQVYWPVHYKNIEDSELAEIEEKMSCFLIQGSRTSPFYKSWVSNFQSKYGDKVPWTLNVSLGLESSDRLSYRLFSATSRPETVLAGICAFGFFRFLENFPLSAGNMNQLQQVNGQNCSLLAITAEEGYLQIVWLLLDKGADINSQSGLFGSALGAASAQGHLQVVQLLLDKGADINFQSEYYGSALGAASARGHLQVVQLLLDRGANLYQRDFQGRTAILHACRSGEKDIVQMYTNLAPDLGVLDYQSRNCLHFPASHGHVDLVNWLLEQGLDPNSIDRDGWTPLHWAARNGSVGVAQLLGKAGAVACIENIYGFSAGEVAVYHNHKEFLEATNITMGLSPYLVYEKRFGFDYSTLTIASLVGKSLIEPATAGNDICWGCFCVSYTRRTNGHVI